MATLTGNSIQSTYMRLLQVPNADGANATPTAVQDGEGTATPLLIGTTAVQVSTSPVADTDVVRLIDLSFASFSAAQLTSGTLAEARMPANYRNADRILGRSITTNPPSNNQVYVYSTSTGQWELQTLGASLAGDVTGTTSNSTVVRIQGRDVDSSAPQAGDVLGWDGAQWTSTAPATGSADNLKLPDGTSIDDTLRSIQDDNVSPNSAALSLALSQVRVLPAMNGTATFDVQNAAGSSVLTVDTTNARALLAALRLNGASAGVLQADANGDVTSAALTNAELPVIDDTVHGNRGGGALHAAATSGANGFMPAADKGKLDLYPSVTGLTAGQVLRATGAATVAYGALQATDLPTHASRHATGGADALAPADINALPDEDASVSSSAVGTVPLTVTGTSGQTAALLEIYDAPAGTKVGELLSNGTLRVLKVEVVDSL